ncbi:MAG TPA: MFS transporter, partial [Xanthobacteraceae bacterium]|nr:MFS transporter [Xanthobacteraceae bacterium]
LVAALMLLAAATDMLPLALYMALSSVALFTFGLMMSNFTALAMEPQGHIAGTASSLYGSITTLIGIAVGVTLGQVYDGTLLPFAIGSLACTLVSVAIVLVTERGRMFTPSKQAH